MSSHEKPYRKNLHSKLYHYIPQDVVQSRNEKKAWKYGYNAEFDMVVISKDGTIGEVLNINDLVIALPSQPKGIRYYTQKPEVQKWRRYEVPQELADFDKFYGEEADSDSIIVSIHEKHREFIRDDLHRIEYGDWFMNDGEAVYITGYYYFFLQHYYLTENMDYPDFRMPQRDYFIWLEACFADERCLGSLLLKSRRSAFTTGSSSMVICEAIRTQNGFFPIMSKKDKDAADLFDKHIVTPLLKLPKHLQPMRSGEVKPKKELIFASSKKKLTTNNKSDSSFDGLQTKITYYSTTPDAYDGTRVRFFSINDEIGKLPFDVNEWWNQAHKRCHMVGSTIVGKAICGSTANPPNQGGKNYEDFYNNSKLSRRNKSGQTPTGLYSIFIPADLSYMGFFDEFGYCIYYDPKEPVLNELGEMRVIGVKSFIDDLEMNCDNLKDLNAQKRNEPRVDTDAFLDEDATSMFGTEGLLSHKNWLKQNKDNPKFKQLVFRFDLYYENGDDTKPVKIQHSENGRFFCCWMPPLEYRNKFKEKNGRKYPYNADLGAFGCDPYDSSKVRWGNGSKLSLKGITKNNEYQLAEYERNRMFLSYNFRASTKDEAEEDVIKACLYFSMPILLEINKKSLAVKFKNRGLRGFVVENPLKKKSELTPDEQEFGGIYSHPSNIKPQQDALETWINDNLPSSVDEDNIKVPFVEDLEDAEIYTPETRQQRDRTIAWMYAVLATSQKVKKKEPITEASVDVDFVKLFEMPQTVIQDFSYL